MKRRSVCGTLLLVLLSVLVLFPVIYTVCGGLHEQPGNPVLLREPGDGGSGGRAVVRRST
ncbi:MAG: hypothetical protein ACLRT5_01780 [Lachnospiraceae bacterium]